VTLPAKAPVARRDDREHNQVVLEPVDDVTEAVHRASILAAAGLRQGL
jgi:hypothetical protein